MDGKTYRFYTYTDILGGSMKLISFAYTTDVFNAPDGNKTVTRRYWKESHAQKFKEGDIVQAFDKIPKYGGERVGCIRILRRPYRQKTSMMTEADYIREGFAWMEVKGKKIQGKHPREFFDEWRQKNDTVWVVEFEKIPCPMK